MRHRSGIALAAVALAMLAGCDGPAAGGGSRPEARGHPGTRAPSDAERIRALLAARAAALAAGDAEAYAATATRARRPRDRAAAARAARLPLRDVALRVRAMRVHGARAHVRVSLSYRFRGVVARYVADRRLRARRTAAGWRVAAVGGRRGRPPWEVARFRTVRAPHVLLLAAPGVDAAGLADALAVAYRGMARTLPGRRLPRTVLAVGVAGNEDARRLTTEIRGVRTLAAIADSAVREHGRAREVARVVSQRLVVVAPAWAAMDAGRRARVLTHELVHLALAGGTSGRVPSWLVEGVAMAAAGDDRSAEAAARIATGRAVPLSALCAPNAIGRLSGDAQAAAYATASAAARRLEVDHGRRALLRAYAAFGDPKFRGRPGCRLTDRVLRRTLGTRLRELDAALAGG